MGNSIPVTIAEWSKMDQRPMEALISWGDTWKDEGHGKKMSILKSASGITSLISSSILIWMIGRSHKGLSTTQNRLLVGICFFDIISSLAYSMFNIMSPSDNDYVVWNARGNEATCDAQGFLLSLGIYGGLYYNAALNLYYLAKVKKPKGDEYIRTRIEPWLHSVPIIIAFSYSITALVGKHFNDDWHGICMAPVHFPPHCFGYNVTDIRDEDGFEIPCGRGLDGATSIVLAMLVLAFIPAILILASLGIIYQAIKKQEKKFRGSVYVDGPQQHPSLRSRLRASITNLTSSLQVRSSTRVSMSTDNDSDSRAVMHKALGYSIAWLLSYGAFIIARLIHLVSGNYLLALVYVIAIFGPLQGFFNLAIYMHPKVISARKPKRRGGTKVPWCKAISKAFWSKGKDPKRMTRRPAGNFQPRRQTSNSVFDRSSITTGILREPQPEEDKCEVRPPQNVVPPMKTSTAVYAPNFHSGTSSVSAGMNTSTE